MDAQGDLRITVGVCLLGELPVALSPLLHRRLQGFRLWLLVLLMEDPTSHSGLSQMTGMSIAASESRLESSGDEDSAVLHPSEKATLFESDPELTAMLSQAAVSVKLEWNPPPWPKHLRLVDWYLGAEAC